MAEAPGHPAVPVAQPLRPPDPDTRPGAEFARYYEQQMPRLLIHLVRRGASWHEAGEAAQAAFTEAFTQWDRIAHPAGWLRLVAYRLYLRRPARREEPTDQLPDGPGGSCPLHKVELKESEQWVLSALSALPSQQSAVMAWHLDGFATREIAEALGTTPAAVRQNLARARARLKTILLAPTDRTGDGGRE
ncbi:MULTISPECIES: RNA polymerase sigma factor [Streptomyces]|nr:MULTISPECIES: sigma-70 family RNA polymerase sigma factor [Streptomyces]ADU56339.1 RNA polymerase ECF-subfamily sigma factor [Streptomyces sp. KCTC 11604BP]ADX99505.1 ECF subfamily RNA polymerase sigma factor [Streptomyces sp. MJM7001]AZK92742.1 RNA polymerase subunit sigma [Streptomyces tsukubensis]EIF88217.1 ECF subfamily RNA polymerase sigma factor [Streptomyces tsukubensis NRRL18488]